jgi:hypothetical protein
MNAKNLGWNVGIALVFCTWFVPEVSAELATKTVQIDCTISNPKSINQELRTNVSSLEKPLIIEILGMCDEDVVILRHHNVILRGSDPVLDGIRAVSGYALAISHSGGITVENLKITGSETRGIQIGDSGGVSLINTRAEGNGIFGLMVFRSYVIAVDAEFTGNGWAGVSIGGSTPARLDCTRCTIEANPTPGDGYALLVRRGSNVVFRNGVLAGEIGLYVGTVGQIDLINTEVTGSSASINAEDHARVSASGGSLDGPFSLGTKSSLTLRGVGQTSATPNSLFSDAYLNTSALGSNYTNLVSTDLADFSNASFRDTNLGILTCAQGSNAFCDGTVTKTSSSCSLCP